MYQANEKIDLSLIATDIAQWSIMHYGYFVKSSLDKVELIQRFAEDLSRLPENALRFVLKVEEEWTDSGQTRPPTIPEFLAELRKHHNRDNTQKQIAYKPDNRTDYAGMWNSAEHRGLEACTHYMKTIFNKREVSPATKYVIREYFLKQGYDFVKLNKKLGM